MPQLYDLKKMKLTVVECRVILYPYINPGKVDKRYKSGYRIKAHAQVKTELEFTLQEKTGRYQLHEVLEIIGYGRYMVVYRDGELINTKMVRVSDFGFTTKFTIPKEVEAISVGQVVSESSSYATPKL